MSTEVQTNSFIDSVLARLLGLAVALLLAFLLWYNWSSDFKTLFAGGNDTPDVVSAAEPAKPVNPALEECLVQRVGDVDKMKADGILSDAQYTAFKSRAESLCRAQNQG